MPFAQLAVLLSARRASIRRLEPRDLVRRKTPSRRFGNHLTTPVTGRSSQDLESQPRRRHGSAAIVEWSIVFVNVSGRLDRYSLPKLEPALLKALKSIREVTPDPR